MIKLDKRLTTIIDEIEGNRLADIGADHGKVVVSAICMAKIKTAVAVDISSKSLVKAQKLAKLKGVNDKISFLVGDGLRMVDNSVDCIVIAGMGGIEISKILQQKLFNAKYILVPHQDSFILREFLMKNNFTIQKDYVVEEGRRFYDIIVASVGNSNYTSDELYLGKNKPSTEDFERKILYKKNKIKKIIDNAKGYENISTELQGEWEEIKKWVIK